MNFSDLRNANRARQREWPGNTQADTAFRTIEVSGESGEAIEEVLLLALAGLQMSKHTGRVAEQAKKLLRAERGIKGSTASTADLADEIADCIIAIDLLADQTGINLAEAVASKFNRTSEKYGLETRFLCAEPDDDDPDNDDDSTTCLACADRIGPGDMYSRDYDGDPVCEACSPTWEQMLAEPEFFWRYDENGEQAYHTAETAKAAADAHVAAGGSLTDKMGLAPW